jgi:hypothetical protein
MRRLAILLDHCALVFLVLSSTATAALVRYEPFNYVDVGTTVEGKTNPDGASWLGAYSGGVAPSLIKVASGNLAMPPQLLPAVGNSAEIDGGPSTMDDNSQQQGKALRLPFASDGVAANSGGTIYYSLALRVDELTGATNTTGGWLLGLNNTTGATTTNPTAAGARLQARVDPTDGNKYNLGVFRNVNATAAAPTWSGPLTVGETLFLVGSYEAVAGGQNDIARLWINPDPSTFGDASFSPTTTAPTLIDDRTGTGTDIGIFSVLLRQSPAPHVTLDELRIGTTWADVTPVVPEPSSLVLAAGALAAARRKRIHQLRAG